MSSIFENINTILPSLGTLLAIIGAFGALWKYSQSQQFRRVQNLSNIWERFFREERLRSIFTLLNDLELDEDRKTPSDCAAKLRAPALNADKLHYLALLEDVALYARLGQIDHDYAIDRFLWFFYYAFECKSTRDVFWDSLGGDTEREQPYWKLSREFASKCAQHLGKPNSSR